MGWAKYAEDNYEIFLERQVWKNRDSVPFTTSYVAPKKVNTTVEDENSFAKMFEGESCFSL